MTDFREFQDGELVPGTRYRVAGLIGTGGMGRVYEVEHVELGKRFVLKSLQRELSRREDLVARLRNEWRALARLEHPSIVSVTDAGTSDNGVPFYVMERLEGETLAALLHREHRLLPQQALAIAAGILDGLHAAHQIGIVHRDVKPPNIFLTRQNTVKVLDFGIAKIRDAKGVITARGIAVGTPRYMSPEQAQGTPVDARSDIYATGLMLFEMVSGRGPFDDANDHNELLLAHLARKAPLLSSISVVAPELDALVAGMLAKDPRERPGSARQVGEALRALGQRYKHYVATEAPTLHVDAGRSDALEVPTRVEGQRATQPAPPATRPDGVASARYLDDPTTLEPAWAMRTTSATRTTPETPPSRGTPRPDPELSAPALSGADTLVDPVTQAPTRVPAPASQRTEPLLAVPLSPGGQAPTDAGPTRTSVPLAQAPNFTPPPVVPGPVTATPKPPRVELAGSVLAAAAVMIALAAFFAVRREPGVEAPLASGSAAAASPSAPVSGAAPGATRLTEGTAAVPPAAAEASSKPAPLPPPGSSVTLRNNNLKSRSPAPVRRVVGSAPPQPVGGPARPSTPPALPASGL